jgi:hypothetical protein
MLFRSVVTADADDGSTTTGCLRSTATFRPSNSSRPTTVFTTPTSPRPDDSEHRVSGHAGAIHTAARLEFMRKAAMTYQARVQTVGQLHRAGVRVVSGSDGGISASRRHGVLPEAVIDLVDGACPQRTPSRRLPHSQPRRAASMTGRVASQRTSMLICFSSTATPSPISLLCDTRQPSICAATALLKTLRVAA